MSLDLPHGTKMPLGPVEHPAPTYDSTTGNFNAPIDTITVFSEDGVRLEMGKVGEGPSICVERHARGWMILLNLVPGGDTTAYVVVHDDGRAELTQERHNSDEMTILRPGDSGLSIEKEVPPEFPVVG